nr:SWIM zinc finger family protein [Streptomyces cavernae]
MARPGDVAREALREARRTAPRSEPAPRGTDTGAAARGTDTGAAARGTDTGVAARGTDAEPAPRGTDTGAAARGTDTGAAARGTETGVAPRGTDTGAVAPNADAEHVRGDDAEHVQGADAEHVLRGPVSEVAPAGRRPAGSPKLSEQGAPPLGAPGESPSTSSTRTSARHAESTLPHSRLRSSGGTPMTPPGPPFGRTTPLPTQTLGTDAEETQRSGSGDAGDRAKALRELLATVRRSTTPPPARPHGPAHRARTRTTNPRGPDPAAATTKPSQRPGPRTTSTRGTRSAAPPGELRRTFPRLPAHPEGGAGSTWWGKAWITALEAAALDAARLGRGRKYAEQGAVDAITVTPGLVLAYVHGSRPRPYRVQVRLRTLDDEDWDRFLDAAVERPGHIAALLDKDLPHSLADCGVDLLPVPGDLVPQCNCPDTGHPCKHAAALIYQTARLLDEDPFVLLLMRGRGERELLDTLSRRNATRAARAQSAGRSEDRLPGVRATEALVPRTLPALPAPLPPPPHPQAPPAYPASPGGPDPLALDQLATDAAARAHALLTAERDPVAELTLWQDAVRLAAHHPGSGLTAATRALYSSLATATGRTPADLARAVAAWRQGGAEGLAALEDPWDPPAGRFDRARPLLLAADLPAFRPWRNRLTHPAGHIQLRLGRDGLWYAYESERDQDDWWPRGTPDLDPVGALTGIGVPDDTPWAPNPVG